MSKSKRITASNLAFSRGLDVADGVMHDLLANDVQGAQLEVRVHGLRGVQSLDPAGDKKAFAAAGNIQDTETTRTSPDALGLQVNTSIRVHPLATLVHSCNLREIRLALKELFAQVKKDDAILTELSCRYARNILNGRWLWRNRSLGKSEVEVRLAGQEVSVVATRGALDFDQPYTEQERQVADWIAESLLGTESTEIQVVGRVRFGIPGSYEVYPSQEKPVSKSEGDPSRLQYKLYTPKFKPHDGIQGYAGLRDAKIANAIRTIDTWYDGFDEYQTPISIEPTGANLEYLDYFRKEVHAFELLELNNLTALVASYSSGAYLTDTPAREKLLFLLAVILRGGVLGSSDKPGKDGEK